MGHLASMVKESLKRRTRWPSKGVQVLGFLLAAIAVYFFAAPSASLTATASASASNCLATFGEASSVTPAMQLVAELQQMEPAEALAAALSLENPLHKALQSVPGANASGFEDCAGLQRGVVALGGHTLKASSYREFIRESVMCTGNAFRAAQKPWPMERMAFDMIAVMGLSWIESSWKLPALALHYHPQLQALDERSLAVFTDCMRGLSSHSGKPLWGVQVPALYLDPADSADPALQEPQQLQGPRSSSGSRRLLKGIGAGMGASAGGGAAAASFFRSYSRRRYFFAFS